MKKRKACGIQFKTINRKQEYNFWVHGDNVVIHSLDLKVD
jgi:hypothetical protein